MADEEKSDDEASIFKVDTVPPPDGDGDAYNAPTKVGPVSSEAWVELIRKADAEGERNAEADRQLAESGPSSKPPISKSQAKATDAAPPASKPEATVKSAAPPAAAPPPPPAAAAGPANDDIPKVYNEESDESNMATLLHPRAKDVVDSSLRADDSVFGQAPASAPVEDASTPATVLGEDPSSKIYMFAVAVCIAVFVAGLIYYYLRSA
jgi:hypothetical protein